MKSGYLLAVTVVIAFVVLAGADTAWSDNSITGSVLTADSSQTQPTSSPSPEEVSRRTFGADASNLWKAAKHTIASPLHWNTRDLRTFGIWSAVAVGAVFVDEDVRRLYQKNQNDISDVIADIGNVYGDKGFTITLSLLTYGTGVAFNSEKLRDTGIMLTDLILTVLLVQQPLRIIVGRARPEANEGNLSFNPLTIDETYASFVSGHVWSAVGISVVMGRQIGNRWASMGLGALALMTATSRMYVDKHWLSDVIMGGALGYYSANKIVDWHNQNTVGNLSLRPTPNGLVLVYRF